MFNLNSSNMKKVVSLLVLMIIIILPTFLYGQDEMVNKMSEYSTPLLILSGIGGIMLHILMKVRDRFSKDSEKLTWDRIKSEPDWGRHILNSLVSLGVVIMVALMKDHTGSIFPVTYVTIAGVAYQADSIWKNITNFKEKT